MGLHSFRKNNVVLNYINGAVYDLPVPVNISYLWNFGSLMGFCLVLQITTGLFLACHYSAHDVDAFNSVWRISRNIQNGWLVRSFHINGASGFFFCIYIHIARGIYYHSFSLGSTWVSGVHLLLLLMAIAFSGYVLPWAQMSFWGATVITNMFSIIPFIGEDFVKILWGGEIIQDVTLKRFFVFHFLCPFFLAVMSLIHMGSLHSTGSSNPLGVSSKVDCIPFYPYFVFKDFFGLVVFVGGLAGVVFVSPDLFQVSENFEPMDRFHTPIHIEPEWYFLFAYTILRAIPHKVGGIVALVSSVTILYIMPFYPKNMVKGVQYNFAGQVMFWFFVVTFVTLTFWGMCKSHEDPYPFYSLIYCVYYHLFFILYIPISFLWEKYTLVQEPEMEGKYSCEKKELYYYI